MQWEEFKSESELVDDLCADHGIPTRRMEVTNRFFDYVRSPGSMPEWERANMLAKYYVSTKGVELARC